MEEDEKEELTKEEQKENVDEKAIIEVKSKKKKKKRKGSYILGTIGAVLGGFVAAMVWVLSYTFTEQHIVIPIFASLIPIGAYLGYKIFIGKMSKLVRVILIIISLILIISVTTIICPSILIIESGYSLTWENLTGLYSNVRADVRAAIIEDTIAGLAFTIIGIVFTIICFINKKIEGTKEEKNILHEKAKNQLKEQSEIVKKACIDLNCINKENAMKKKEILKQLLIAYNLKRKKAKLYIANCKSNKLLIKYKGKYFYDETDEQEKIEKVKKVKNRFILKKVITLLFLITVVTGAALYISYIKNENTLAGTSIRIEIDQKNQDFYGNREEITNAFGEEAAANCDFVLVDKTNKYELNGKAIPKSNFEGKDIATIIQEDRNNFAAVLGEETISEVLDKQFGELIIKSYNYTYTGVNGNQYRSAVYLCETQNHYVWISVYSDFDVEVTQIDTIMDNFIK